MKNLRCKLDNSIFFKSIILFGIELDVCLYGFITLRKICFTILLLYFIKDFNRQKKRLFFSRETILLFLMIVVIGIYAAVIYVTKVTEYSNIIEGISFHPIKTLSLFLWIGLFPILLSVLFRDTLEFCRAQWYITLFQSSIAILSKISKDFALFIYSYFYVDGGRALDSIIGGRRVVCIGMGGATASVILFAGLICAIYLFFNDTENNKYRIFVEYCFVMFSMFFIGRTGLYMGMISLFWVMVHLFIHKRKIFYNILLMLIMIGSALIIYILFAPESYMKSFYINWVGEIFVKGIGEGSTIDILSKMEIPSLSPETFWGTGIIYGISRTGIHIFHDSGYVRMYAALGIPGFLLYYGTIYGFYLLVLNKMYGSKNRWICIWLLIAIMICEYKEPFISKTPLLTIMSLMFCLEKKQLMKSNCIM